MAADGRSATEERPVEGTVKQVDNVQDDHTAGQAAGQAADVALDSGTADAVVLPFPGAEGREHRSGDNGSAEPPSGHPPGRRNTADEDTEDLTDAANGVTGAALGLVGQTPTGRRVRARLARFNAPWQSAAVREVLEPLIAQHRASHPKADVRLLQRAYDMAEQWHTGQYRKSGDPYITHPLAVATILAELGMDTTTLVAALLHDTIEDSDYTLERMQADFGGEVSLLVDGVT
jgi:GTP pyrophosphokinase